MKVEEYVLTLKAKGYSMKQIAKMLGISRYRVSCIIRSSANHEKQCTTDNQKLGYGALFI